MLKPVWNPFSRYADRLEKKVDKILKRVAFIGVFESQRKVLELMQENLVILDLWLEARFKGYKYLHRGVRGKMYRHAERIGEIFLEFAEKTRIDDAAVTRNLQDLGLARPSLPGDSEKLRLLTMIMLFLRPDAGRFQYLEGASFGKLLSNPDRQQKMIGDCNQIVTFYTFLYSLKFDVKELQIKIMKEHVCLHFKGVDIEATAGGFANYKEFLRLLPIVELIPTNLLDVSDFRDKQIQVNPRDLLKSSQLAFNLSSERDLVTNNLKISYHNVAVDALRLNDFETAAFFAEKAGTNDPETLQFLSSIYHNAVIFYAKAHDFKKARFYAGKSAESDLRKYVDEQEAFYEFNNGSLGRARELFMQAGNQQMLKACWAKEYNQIQSRVAGIKEISLMKSHRADYQKMLDLARKMEDNALAESLRDLLGKI